MQKQSMKHKQERNFGNKKSLKKDAKNNISVQLLSCEDNKAEHNNVSEQILQIIYTWCILFSKLQTLVSSSRKATQIRI